MAEIIIRAEKPSEHDSVAGILREAFGRENEASLLSRLRGTGDFLPPLSLVADRGGELMGYALFFRVAIQAGGRAHPALALAPLGVRPQFQRQGVGERLVRHGLERCRSSGYPVVVVLGPSQFFTRFGFSPARAQGLETDFSVPDETFLAMDLEGKTLGTVRGKVAFPQVFR